MNRFTKVLAPVALAVAAFGVQASELAYGDIGAQPVRAGSTVSQPAVIADLGRSGEVAHGDFGLKPVTTGTRSVQSSTMIARPALQPNLTYIGG